MGNSLLAVRGINHEYIVVERVIYLEEESFSPLPNNRLAILCGKGRYEYNIYIIFLSESVQNWFEKPVLGCTN